MLVPVGCGCVHVYAILLIKYGFISKWVCTHVGTYGLFPEVLFKEHCLTCLHAHFILIYRMPGLSAPVLSEQT